MSDVAIRVGNISKRYKIGQREPYKALPDVMTDAVVAPFHRLRGTSAFAIRNPAMFLSRRL